MLDIRRFDRLSDRVELVAEPVEATFALIRHIPKRILGSTALGCVHFAEIPCKGKNDHTTEHIRVRVLNVVILYDTVQ